MLNERRLAFEDATARVRYLHRPGWKNPDQDPFAKDRQENAEIVRKVRHIRQQWSRIKLRESRRRHRHKLASRARLAKLSPPAAQPATEGADTDGTVAATTISEPRPTHQPAPTTRRAPRIVYPLLRKPMTRKAINRKLHKIENRRILHHAIKSRLHLTLKAHKWGQFPRTRRTCRFLWMQAQDSLTDRGSIIQIIPMSTGSPLERHISISEKLPKLPCMILITCGPLSKRLDLFHSIEVPLDSVLRERDNMLSSFASLD